MDHKDLSLVLSPECSIPLLENFDFLHQILLPQEVLLALSFIPLIPEKAQNSLIQPRFRCF